MATHTQVDSHLLSRIVQLFVAIAIVCCIAGCDDAPTPGQELFVLENPTRSWKVPKYKPVDLDTAPRLVADYTEYAVGTVEPHVQQTHVFTVHNVGPSPLTLKRMDQNPIIAILPLEKKLTISPGETQEMRLSWTPNATPRDRSYGEAVFRTNDPKQPELHLVMAASVRSSVSVDPPVLNADRAKPDRSTEMAVLITSQRWNDFNVSDIESNLPGLTWDVEPAEAKHLAALGADSGWLLRAELPTGLPSGEIEGRFLSLQVRPEGETESRSLEIPITGNVLRRLAVYGESIDETGTIEFGVLPYRQEHKLKYVVKVYDEVSTLVVRNVTVKPDFIKAQLEPYRHPSAPENLYQLTVTLPASAPPCIHRGQRMGEIQFEFDHPRISELTLNVDFALTGEARQVLAKLDNSR